MAPITSECVSRSSGASNVKAAGEHHRLTEDGDLVHRDVSLLPTLPTAPSDPAAEVLRDLRASLEASPAHRAR
jgi:hypothetical protein